MNEFIADLDEYFCEKYADYDKLCGLSGYRMPVMQATKINEYGQEVGYTLPKTELRLALQEKKTELLAQLKEKLLDKNFSFSFTPYKWTERIKNFFTPYAFSKSFKLILHKRNLTAEQAKEGLAIDDEVFDGLFKGRFSPTKNLIFSMALTLQLSVEEFQELLWVCYQKLDFAEAADVVVSYLVEQKIFNEEKMKAALAEYNITNLFLA